MVHCAGGCRNLPSFEVLPIKHMWWHLFALSWNLEHKYASLITKSQSNHILNKKKPLQCLPICYKMSTTLLKTVIEYFIDIVFSSYDNLILLFCEKSQKFQFNSFNYVTWLFISLNSILTACLCSKSMKHLWNSFFILFSKAVTKKTIIKLFCVYKCATKLCKIGLVFMLWKWQFSFLFWGTAFWFL